jgi:hypothetical protein
MYLTHSIFQVKVLIRFVRLLLFDPFFLATSICLASNFASAVLRLLIVLAKEYLKLVV